MTTTPDDPRPLFDAHLALTGFAALLGPKRPLLPKGRRIVFYVVTTAGLEARTLDFHAEPMLRTGEDPSPALRVITNERTLSDILLGTFDPTAPRSEHTFLYEGDATILDAIAGALEPGTGWLSMRISETKKRRGR